jgi:hypothetical protein
VLPVQHPQPVPELAEVPNHRPFLPPEASPDLARELDLESPPVHRLQALAPHPVYYRRSAASWQTSPQ